MKKSDAEEVVMLVQEDMDSMDNWFDLWDLIEGDEDLTVEEKEWAHENLGATVVITILSPSELEEG